MSNSSRTDEIYELMAYVDGQLDPVRVAAIERRLERDPEVRRYVDDLRRQNEAVRRNFGAVSSEDMPMRLLEAVQHGRRPAFGGLARKLAPIAASLAVGLVAGWSISGLTGAVSTAEADLRGRTLAAFDVYAAEPTRPVEIAADGTGEMENWFSNRLDMRFSLPRLGDLGFQPIGGRLMIGSKGPAAMLMYENEGGERIVVYVRNDMPPQTKAASAFTERDGVGVMYWADGTRGIGVSARMDRERLSAIAQLVKVQFSET
jgi:anti-sigma factor RsiW